MSAKQPVEPLLVSSGDLPVPREFPTNDFAYMEERYRSILWPRPRPGHKRSGRKLLYNRTYTLLHYQIFEVPVGDDR